jgi:succinate dehydrogenase/fumarate reductase flavoprotein subunit
MAPASSVDVVVVGFGAAGIAAAITAHDGGADVVVLEKTPRELSGGNSRVAGQVWYTPSSPELAKSYLTGLSGEMPVAPDVADAWAAEVCETTAWVLARAEEAKGHIEVDPLDPWQDQGSDLADLTYGETVLQQTGWETTRDEFPEFDNSGGTNYIYFGETQGYARLWLRLKAALEQRGIPVLYETPAAALLRDADGTITGVRTGGREGEHDITARGGVVLACGGFENNPEMARAYLGVPAITPWGSPANTGDGIRMGQKVGAGLQNMYQRMPHFGIRIPGRDIGEFLHPAGPSFIHVRADGRRFVDETLHWRHGKATVGGRIEFHPTAHMWTVFDEDARLAGPLTLRREVFASGWLRQAEHYDWSEDNSVEIEKGWIVRADTIPELAERLGVDPAGLAAEVERYNGFAAQGGDPVCGRPGAAMAPIARAPFYGYEHANLVINTMGGLRKDGRARVLDPDGEVIEGLYCAGEISSTYTWALSGGQSLSDAMAFGRIAGRSAVEAADDAARRAQSGAPA